ncbi:MAG: efflux RND transporter periplasmic adaptor subunit [bacterium]|nr:efflux RND transporter periplasmic adaptor subunit [bacterium]
MKRSALRQPLLIIGAAVLVVALLVRVQRSPEDRPQQNAAPLVRTVVAEPTEVRFTVQANGSVTPRTESELIPQVSGEVVEMSPQLVAGGFFEEDDFLARIDDADYRVDREAARAQVARARSEFGRAEKERARQRRLADRSVASEARIDDAENAYGIAEASLREAQARLERAERDLARTEIRAPYRGRVRAEQVDLGQFVNRGQSIATLYAIDYAEVRLPIPDRELAYLEFGQFRAAIVGKGETTGAKVVLSTEFAGAQHHWEGVLDRTEAELDPRSRMINLVARVPEPYKLEAPRSAPLAIGLFVDAEIEGRVVEDAFVLPRDALRAGDRVYVIDAENRIAFREVEVLRTERDRVVVAGGLVAGEMICTSPLDAAIDGMLVRVSGETAAPTVEDPASEDLAERGDAEAAAGAIP